MLKILQTGSEAFPASFAVENGDFFPRDKVACQ
jgi:hypothetical protein